MTLNEANPYAHIYFCWCSVLFTWVSVQFQRTCGTSFLSLEQLQRSYFSPHYLVGLVYDFITIQHQVFSLPSNIKLKYVLRSLYEIIGQCGQTLGYPFASIWVNSEEPFLLQSSWWSQLKPLASQFNFFSTQSCNFYPSQLFYLLFIVVVV